MMKTLTATIIANLIVVVLFSQPVISDNWVPMVDDIWKQSITFDTPGPGESGANVTWDYSDLNVEGFLFEIVFDWIDPADSPYADSFPDANLCASFLGFGYGYYRNSGSVFEYLGSGNQFGFDIYTNTQTFDYIGMNFQETVVDSYEIVRYNNFTDPMMPKGESSFTYDAYGTLILPDVTIPDAIRLFEIDVETDSVVQGGLTNVRVDSLISYAWIADGSVFPVVLWQRSAGYSRVYINGQLFSDEAEEPDTTFSINPDYTGTSAIARHIALPALDVYPTLARNEIHVTLDGNASIEYSLFSSSGSPMGQGLLSGDLTTINVGQFPPGYYVLKADGFAPSVFVKME